MAKILVVDDDEMILRLFKDVIELIGHEAIAVTSAEFALESLLAGLKVDLLVTDIVMPGMDGVEFVEAILSRKNAMTFPIIMISGEAVQDRLTKVLENDRVTFLQKPIRLNHLVDVLNERVKSDVNP